MTLLIVFMAGQSQRESRRGRRDFFEFDAHESKRKHPGCACRGLLQHEAETVSSPRKCRATSESRHFFSVSGHPAHVFSLTTAGLREPGRRTDSVWSTRIFLTSSFARRRGFHPGLHVLPMLAVVHELHRLGPARQAEATHVGVG